MNEQPALEPADRAFTDRARRLLERDRAIIDRLADGDHRDRVTRAAESVIDEHADALRRLGD